jgi:hypothetical protein
MFFNAFRGPQLTVVNYDSSSTPAGDLHAILWLLLHSRFITGAVMNSNSQSVAKLGVPDKPYPAFPLFAPQIGQRCRKVSGKLHYVGPWADWKAA